MTATTHEVELLDYDEAVARFDPVLGLEVHVELNTATKMFCGCPTAFGAPSPTRRSARCASACPARCRWSTRRPSSRPSGSGSRSTATIAEWCRFARKNYFYPDMPKNFQTSQYDEPIAFDG